MRGKKIQIDHEAVREIAQNPVYRRRALAWYRTRPTINCPFEYPGIKRHGCKTVCHRVFKNITFCPCGDYEDTERVKNTVGKLLRRYA